MVFNSLHFVWFFIAVYAAYRLLPHRGQNWLLLISSYYFYAAWDWRFLGLLAASTIVDFTTAQLLERSTAPGRRRLFLVVSLTFNLTLLGFFKYFNFFADSLHALFATFGFTLDFVTLRVLLPVGISFYTFVTLSYTLDVYLGRLKPIASFLDYALFVTFFPHLVAGPIVRPTQLTPQFAAPKQATQATMLWGLGLIVLGLFEKVVLADGGLANVADKVFAAKGAVGFADAWLGTLAFSGQIFCDFAGYSTIAVGTALCLGFALPDNFRMPYAAIGFSDFWRRWHISLSTWLRDYLYIPLGGNRGTEVRTYVNLMLTMLLGGLWHGASWTFVAWGGLHGLYLAVERWLRAKTGVVGDPVSAWNRLSLALVTWMLVNLTWVFFRAEDFAGAAHMLRGMAGLAGDAAPVLPTMFVVKVVVIVSAIVATQWLMRNRSLEDVVAKSPWWLTAVVCAAMLFAVTITQGSGQAFIYFQF